MKHIRYWAWSSFAITKTCGVSMSSGQHDGETARTLPPRRAQPGQNQLSSNCSHPAEQSAESPDAFIDPVVAIAVSLSLA